MRYLQAFLASHWPEILLCLVFIFCAEAQIGFFPAILLTEILFRGERNRAALAKTTVTLMVCGLFATGNLHAAGSFNGSTSYLEQSTTPVTAVEVTLVCNFNVANLTAHHCLMSISDSAGDLDYFRLSANGAVAGDPLEAEARRSTQGTAASSGAYTANTWQHAAARFITATSRDVWLNGVQAGANTTSVTPSSL